MSLGFVLLSGADSERSTEFEGMLHNVGCQTNACHSGGSTFWLTESFSERRSTLTRNGRKFVQFLLYMVVSCYTYCCRP